jgi:roundabout axon guidance receptor 2
VDDIPPPIIKIGPTNQTLPKGSVATLLCRAGGTPTPEIKWSKDGSPLHTKKRFEVIQSGTLKIDGRHSSRLIIYLFIHEAFVSLRRVGRDLSHTHSLTC